MVYLPGGVSRVRVVRGGAAVGRRGHPRQHGRLVLGRAEVPVPERGRAGR